MKLIKEIIPNEVGLFEIPKNCKLCNADIYQPYIENLFILEKNDNILEVCKDCYLKHKNK